MDTVTWLDDEQQRAWRGLLRLGWLLEAAIGRDLARESRLSLADYQVLVALSETAEGRVRMADLAALLLWSRSRLSHQLARMQERGLVDRTGCQGDRRGAFAVLTDEGRETIVAAAPGHVESIRRHLFAHLRPDQVSALAEVTQTVVEKLHSTCGRVVAESDAACDTEEPAGTAQRVETLTAG